MNRFNNDDTGVNLDTRPVQFPRSAALARTGTGLIVLRLKAGAIFPAFTRLGQVLTLVKDRQYRVELYVRVDDGTVIGNTAGAVVSTFCENTNTKVFVGKDTTVNEAPSLNGFYSKIEYLIVGDGAPWACYVALLGQPSLEPLDVNLSVDDFSVFSVQALTIPPVSNQNLVTDPGFNNNLAAWQYVSGQLVLRGDGWQEDYPFQSNDKPFIRTLPSGNRRLVLRLPSNRGVLQFVGVVQRVSLQAGQKYELSVQYNREEPRNVFSIFNFFIRLPDAAAKSGLVRETQGMLFGLVDVRLNSTNNFGRTTVTFVAPQGSNGYEVVLRLSSYGNEMLSGQYRMSFDNVRLKSVA